MNLAELFKKYLECECGTSQRKIAWEDYVLARDGKRYKPTVYATNKEPKESRSIPTGSFYKK